jgi:ferritin
MDKKLYDELNKQIQEEFYASYLYLSMSNWLEEQNFGGFAQWMKAQWEEEVKHAMKIREFLQDLGLKVNLQPIAKVPTEFKSVLDCFEGALAHEKHVTSRINMLYGLAKDKKEYAAEVFLQWFIKEQVEEEKQTMDAIAALKMAGESMGALMQLNKTYGKRE